MNNKTLGDNLRERTKIAADAQKLKFKESIPRFLDQIQHNAFKRADLGFNNYAFSFEELFGAEFENLDPDFIISTMAQEFKLLGLTFKLFHNNFMVSW